MTTAWIERPNFRCLYILDSNTTSLYIVQLLSLCIFNHVHSMLDNVLPNQPGLYVQPGYPCTYMYLEQFDRWPNLRSVLAPGNREILIPLELDPVQMAGSHDSRRCNDR